MAALLNWLVRALGLLLTQVLRTHGAMLARGAVYFLLFRLSILYFKIGLFVAFLYALINGIDMLAAGIEASMPGELAAGMGRVLPSNFYACVSALLMAKFTVFVLQVKDRLLNLSGNF